MRRLHLRLNGPIPRLGLVVCVSAVAIGGCAVTRTSAPRVVRTATLPVPAVAATPSTMGVSLAVVVARDQKQLRASSYTPEGYVVSHTQGGAKILVFHTVCTGSADGHCQAIQVFRPQDPSPIWVGHYAGVQSFRPSLNGFTVTSVQYAASDPLCCPSLHPITREYRWNGKTFRSARPGSRVSP